MAFYYLQLGVTTIEDVWGGYIKYPGNLELWGKTRTQPDPP